MSADGDAASERLLDLACGGLAAPAGGRIHEEQSPYSWWGMTYTQTQRTAYDADGNVVGTELHRPGTVWSDTTNTDAAGTRSTYDIGGNGLAAQLSTTHDADGRFRGAGFDARANIDVGDVNLTGNLRGSFDLTRDGDGNLEGGRVAAHGDIGAAHEPSGLGVRLSGDASLAAEVARDSEGNIVGGAARLDASAPLDVTYQGERVVGMNLAGLHGSIDGRVNDDGTFDGNIGASRTLLGTSIGGDAHVRTDGTQWDLQANAAYQRQLLGPYGAQAGASLGVDASVGGEDPSLNAFGAAHASVFGRELAGADVNVTLDRNGTNADYDMRHVDPALIPDVSVPSLPEIPTPSLPSLSLPESLPEVRANPTGLPGTSGNASVTEPQVSEPPYEAPSEPTPEPAPEPAPEPTYDAPVE